MRIANRDGRLVIIEGGLAVDVETASGGRFGHSPQAVYEMWSDLVDWYTTTDLPAGTPFTSSELGAPAPAPRQIFAIGLNYHAHASEAGFSSPDTEPPVFTKYVSCLCGPDVEVVLPEGGHTDWEVELVAVIGTEARRVQEKDAWSHVAGLTIGQDLSERLLQMAAPSAQFSLAKSYPKFGPMGPALVTIDELGNPEDLELGCSINGEMVQTGRTSEMIFSVPALVAKLSAVLTLLPGDVIFTGTPPGVGMGRSPQRWLSDGDELHTHITGLGEMRQLFRAEPVQS